MFKKKIQCFRNRTTNMADLTLHELQGHPNAPHIDTPQIEALHSNLHLTRADSGAHYSVNSQNNVPSMKALYGTSQVNISDPNLQGENFSIRDVSAQGRNYLEV